MTTIDPEELRSKLENGEEVRVVDIRPEEDYEENHIENSENRPIQGTLLSGNVEEALAALDDPPDDEELVMVWDAGVASTETARKLQEQGKNATALDGGLNAGEQSQE